MITYSYDKRGNPRATYDTPDEEIEIARHILETKGYRILKCKGVKRHQTLDLFTASAIVRVYDRLNPVNQKKLAGVPLVRKADMCLSCLK